MADFGGMSNYVVLLYRFEAGRCQRLTSGRSCVFGSTRRPVLFVVIAATLVTPPAGRLRADTTPPWLDHYREPAARLIGEALSDTFAWRRLAVLTDSVGNRLSGTPELERAVGWAVAEMKRDGLENVHTEKTMVPHWVRG